MGDYGPEKCNFKRIWLFAVIVIEFERQRIMEAKLTSVIDLMKCAADGDNTALDLLHLNEGFEYHTPEPFDPEQPSANLKEELCEIAYMAAAANKLELGLCEKMARYALSYALFIYNCIYDKPAKVQKVLNGQDVAEDTLEIVRDMCVTTDMLLKVNSQETKRRKDVEEGDGETNEKKGR